MCGFCVVAGDRPADAEALERVLASRGPDGRGEVKDHGCWLLHRRLAIIDPTERSSQPFALADLDAHVAYNGEIYNFREVRNRLHGSWQTDGDTEVFSRALAGRTAMPQLLGMYAGALVEPGGITLTRDRFGIKPLYRTTAVPGGFACASQLRCLAELMPQRTVSTDAIASFLRFGSVLGTTMFDGIDEVSPGTTESWVGGALRDRQSLPPLMPSRDLAGTLRRSVARHLVADVDIAVLLSAGLDSAVVAMLAAETGARPVAVTVAAVQGRDESAEAAATARALGLEHVVVPTSEAQALESIGPFFDAMDQPSIDGFNTFLVTAAIKSLGIRVALSGLGSDELFGGYSSYRRCYLTHRLRHLPAPVLRRAVARGNANRNKIDDWVAARRDLGRLAAITREVFSEGEVERLCGRRFEPQLPPLDGADEVTRSEVWRYMSPMLLRDSDAFSMANSVELRVPFVDDEVAGSAFARPSRARALEGKKAVTDALGSELLHQIVRRPKTGFELPMRQWIDGPLADRLQEALEPGSPLSRHVDVNAARELAATGPWSRKWALVVLNEWLVRHGRTH
jgi:asparagine synthase (glutamine-hydrolysing)